DIRATGLLKRYYGKQLLALGREWEVRSFAYDWRLDIGASAGLLRANADAWFGPEAPFHIVAHSMGGLVARSFMQRYPDRWESMWDAVGKGVRGGRLVMLGTPNHGSFSIPQLYLGLNSLVGKLALLDIRHREADLLAIIRTFAGTYQMLPSTLRDATFERLYDPAAYGMPADMAGRFRTGKDFQSDLAAAVDPERMIYVAGYNEPTVDGVADWKRLRSLDGYSVSLRGDGTVPHKLGFLETPDGRKVPNYFVEEEHGSLPINQSVLEALGEMLSTGRTDALRTEMPSGVRGGDPRAELAARRLVEETQMKLLVTRLRARGAAAEIPEPISFDERLAADALVRGFLGEGVSGEAAAAAAAGGSIGSFPVQPGEAGSVGASPQVSLQAPAASDTSPASDTTPRKMPRIRVRVIRGEIQKIGIEPHTSLQDEPHPVDAVAVGHYTGVLPVNAELKIDEVISEALGGGRSRENIIKQFSERGLIRGELAQPFFLPDPREGREGRIIVIAGMGFPGRFGVPELKVLVRELCWSAGRLGKRHLATVLIGSGNGNLTVASAADAWMRGVHRALLDSQEGTEQRLEAVTFVEVRADRVLDLREAIEKVSGQMKESGDLDIDLAPLSEVERLALKQEAEQRPAPRSAQEEEPMPTRLTVEFDVDTYRFGALTEDASIPERAIAIDPLLVREGIDLLSACGSAAGQMEFGEYLQRLLIPADLREAFSGEAPLVIACDNTAAQIPWEMLTQPRLDNAVDRTVPEDERFLGLRRGVTRQLRTTFAPPPEPPPPPGRILRVLIVADPSQEMPLPGAMQEGALVRDLMQEYNTRMSAGTGNRIEVKALIGPAEATRTNVLKELFLRSYDVLHFAGHCEFNAARPVLSGWIFSGVEINGQRRRGLLTANELRRIDRVPRFIFSNACESGVLPERVELHTSALAPSFAEAFFERGVANIVCTAWPVNDLAAYTFAEVFYRALLGFEGPPLPAYRAMQEARRAVQKSGAGAQTWGAYQHYGNPNLRFLREVKETT
ncbi:MAG: CHAT domain-containing protein, partial [Bryobacteraceae bacterium]